MTRFRARSSNAGAAPPFVERADTTSIFSYRTALVEHGAVARRREGFRMIVAMQHERLASGLALMFRRPTAGCRGVPTRSSRTAGSETRGRRRLDPGAMRASTAPEGARSARPHIVW